MSGWTVGKKLFTGVGLLAAMLVLTGSASVAILASMKEQLDIATHRTGREIDLALRLQMNAKTMRSEQRHVLLAGFNKDEQMLRDAQRAIDGVLTLQDRHIRDMESLLESASHPSNLMAIATATHEWQQVNDEVVRSMAAGRMQDAVTLARTRGNALVDAIDHESDDLLSQLVNRTNDAVIDQETAYVRARWGLLALIVGTTAVAGLVLVVVRGATRQLRRSAADMRDGAEHVASAAAQVSTSAQALSLGASEQAASLEETSASMEQMAAMTSRTAANSQQVADVMAEVDATVTRSNAALTSMVSSMAAIEDSSHRVGKIIKTIDEIAFQTNILALNAAVEAARAGEAGMGFAVVADEVRNLAQRSAQAAKDTASLVEASLATSGEGAKNVAQVAQSIQAITSGVSRVKGLVEEVSAASHEQSQGIQQVSQAIARMERVTHNTAATAEENAAASEELSAQAEVSMSIVHQLQAMVGLGRRAADGRRQGRSSQGAGTASPPNLSPFARRAGKAGGTRSEESHPLGTGTFGSF